jgi:ATP-dependent RNA helicase DDX10/DBP4
LLFSIFFFVCLLKKHTGTGSALLFVMPSEAGFVSRLAQKGIVLDHVEPKAHRLEDPSSQIEALLAQDSELRYLAQKAFVCYMRSVNLSANKDMHDVTKLPYREFSQSLGLITVPKIKFGKSQRAEKNAPFALQQQKSEKKQTPVPRIEKLINRQPQFKSLAEPLTGEDDADDFLVLQRADHELEEAGKKRTRDEEANEEEEKKDEKKEEKPLTAKEKRSQRRLAEKKARKEKQKQKKTMLSEEQVREIPKTVEEQEALALELLQNNDF